MVSGSQGKFHKPDNKATFEDADVSQVDVNFRLTTLVEGEGKIFQGKGILCKKYRDRLIQWEWVIRT